MMIPGIGSGVQPYAPQAGQGGDAVGELQRQKETLVKQLEAVKAKPKKSEAEQKAAEKQVKALKKQIAAIDQKIQKASQNKNKEAAKQDAKNPSAAENATQQENALAQIEEWASASKKNKSPFETTGNLIDIYI